MKTVKSAFNYPLSRFSVASLVTILSYGFSTVFSGLGIFNYIENMALPYSVKISGSILLTVIFSFSAFYCWKSFGRNKKRKCLRSKHLKSQNISTIQFVIGGTIASSLSVFTAFSAMIYWANGPAIQSALNSHTLKKVIHPIAQFEDRFEQLAMSMNSVSNYANHQSGIEGTQGQSCGPSEIGFGPIARLRAQHALESNKLVYNATSLADDANLLISQLAKVDSQFQVHSLYTSARKLVQDKRRKDIIQWASTTSKGYSGEGFFWEEKIRTCRDLDMVRKLDDLLLEAGKPIPIPEIVPVLRKATLADTMAINFTILAGTNDEATSSFSRGALLPYLIVAAILDLIGAISACSNGMQSATRLKKSELMELHRISWILENFIWTLPANKKGSNSKSALLVPHFGDIWKTRDAHYLVELLDLSPDPRKQLIPLELIHPGFEDLVERFRMMTGNATKVTVYPINSKNALRLIKEEKRAARLALEFDRYESEEYPSEVKAKASWRTKSEYSSDQNVHPFSR